LSTAFELFTCTWRLNRLTGRSRLQIG